MTAAVLQSNYIPWRGYFDLIHDADVFVFYDDVQYTVNDWRNRNRVKTANGVVWLTIPVGNQNDRRICDVQLRDDTWARKHWMTIEQSYRKAPYFSYYERFLRDIYASAWTSLSELNQTVIRSIARDLLGITTEFRDSREFVLHQSKSDRLLSLLRQIGATRYISGPAARAYLDVAGYERAGIEVEWKDYGTYPPYPQLHGEFVGGVSIVDTLMCCGDRTPEYVWGYREASEARA
ncbi:MAG TPA: WbqC family protein [Vicinamibacterales bacterium]|nr:WbqC family protein [Vicinamibacterales bacterium]